MANRGFRLTFGRMVLLLLLVLLVIAGFFVQDWHQLWTISSTPDNVPIVAMIPLVIFFTWLGLRQASANDRLVEELDGNTQLAKTHHRKTLPWRPGWARELHVWPFLVRIEFLAAVIVTVILFVWSITLNAPLEEPANPNLTMNPSKAPWYFLGLQEMLVYFDPWIAGVVMPSLMMVGLMVFPYVDSNPLGNGYYTYRQRRFALWMFGIGWFTWLSLIFIGTFIRGPGWVWFWPGQRWDHNVVVNDRNVDLHDWVATSRLGRTLHLNFLSANPGKFIFGAIIVGTFFLLCGLFLHWLMTRGEFDFKNITNWQYIKNWARTTGEFERKVLDRTSILQYMTFQFFAISVLFALPAKLILRQAMNIKYVWVTPWFNI
jgi:cytochrome b/b6/petD-like protein